MARKVRQSRLPGVEGGIPELEQIGYEYASIRDQRMKLLAQEVELKGQGLEAMHRHKVTSYKYEDLTMTIERGEEALKVTVAKKTHEETGEETA